MGSHCTAWSYTEYVMNVNRRWLIHSFVITWFCISQRFTPQAPGLIWELIITRVKNQPRSFFIWSFKALDWGLNCSNPQQFCFTPNLEFAKIWILSGWTVAKCGWNDLKCIKFLNSEFWNRIASNSLWVHVVIRRLGGGEFQTISTTTYHQWKIHNEIPRCVEATLPGLTETGSAHGDWVKQPHVTDRWSHSCSWITAWPCRGLKNPDFSWLGSSIPCILHL